MEFVVDLNKVEDVKEFVRVAGMYDTNIIVSSQDRNFAVDGSSLMGIFSLDLSNPVIVRVSDKEAGEAFRESIEKLVMCVEHEWRLFEILEGVDQGVTVDETKNVFDEINNPQYYAGTKIEAIDYIEDKQLGFCLGNVVKYVSRAGRKHSEGKTDKEKEIQDLEKAKWYLERRIFELKEGICG